MRGLDRFSSWMSGVRRRRNMRAPSVRSRLSRGGGAGRRGRLLGVVAALILLAAGSTARGEAATVPVRAPEGSAHGFLLLRGTKAEVLAQGDWWQIPNGDRLEVHLRFRFADGSLSHETFVLMQHRVWTLQSYRSEQRGPSFPRDLDAFVERESGRYTVKTRERTQASTKLAEGRIDLPEDVYGFGMLALLLKELEPRETVTAHVLAFTPKPRILSLQVSADGEDIVTIEGLTRKTARYVAKAKLGGPLGLLASVAGRQPPALHVWMAGDPIPTFVRFDGPFYVQGPVWRVELSAPRWGDDTRK